MPNINLTTTISLGQIFTALVVAIGWIVTWARQNERQEMHTKTLLEHTQQMDGIDKTLRQISESVAIQAKVMEMHQSEIMMLRGKL